MAELQQLESAGNLTPLTWVLPEPLPAKLVRSEKARREVEQVEMYHSAQSMIGTIIIASDGRLLPDWSSSRAAGGGCRFIQRERALWKRKERATLAELAHYAHTSRSGTITHEKRVMIAARLHSEIISVPDRYHSAATSSQGGTASDVALVCNISYNGCSFDLAIDQSLV